MKNKLLTLFIVSTSFVINTSEWDGNGFDDSGTFGLAQYNHNYEQLEKNFCSGDINTQNKQQCTALHLAARYGADKNVILFLKNGTNPNIKERYGKSPLEYAFIGLEGSNFNNGVYGNYQQEKIKPYLNIITILLEYGADPNVQRYGSTLLHSIVFLHDVRDPIYYETLKIVMPQLVKHGLDWSIKNNDDLTAYQLAKKSYHPKIIELFESVGIKK